MSDHVGMTELELAMYLDVPWRSKAFWDKIFARADKYGHNMTEVQKMRLKLRIQQVGYFIDMMTEDDLEFLRLLFFGEKNEIPQLLALCPQAKSDGYKDYGDNFLPYGYVPLIRQRPYK